MQNRHGHLRVLGTICAAGITLSACQAAPQPDVAITCAPGSIDLAITNTSDASAAYTVTVRIDRAGLIEDEQYSSNVIPPGQTRTVSDDRPDDRETCSLVTVEVFPQ